MTINPRIIIAPNGRRYACFFSAGYAYKWARTIPALQQCMAVRVGNMAAFLI